MKKTIVFLLVLALVSFALVSCERDVVSYCPFCGSTNIKEVSDYNKNTGITEIYYKCQNSACEKTFGAGKL